MVIQIETSNNDKRDLLVTVYMWPFFSNVPKIVTFCNGFKSGLVKHIIKLNHIYTTFNL